MQKKYFRYIILSACLANLLLFVRFYTMEYLPSVNLLEVSDLVYNLLCYPAKIIEFGLTPLSAIIVFSMFYGNRKKLVISSLLLSIPRVIYLFPYYYLYENALGNNSLESIGLSFLISVFGAAVLFAHILLLTLVLRYVSLLLIKKNICKQAPVLSKKENRPELKLIASKKLPEEIKRRDFTDLSVPISCGIFSAVFIEFLFPLVNEIISVVEFFTAYKGTFTAGEIFSIVFAFVFLLFELVAIYSAGILLKELSLKAKTECQNEQKEN